MADIYLYTGESNPNDVRLRVFASIFLAIVGVAASPAIGQGSITATVPVSGVSGSAAIGVGSFNADFTISGVAAGATVGATRIDVSATLAGVAASPAIGTGTVETSANVLVNLVGVAASPAIGTGTVVIQLVRIGGAGDPIRRVIRRHTARRDILVLSEGVAASPRVGKPRFIVRLHAVTVPVAEMFALIDGRVMLTGATSSPDIGGGSVTSTIDFLDEELIALIEDA